MTIQDLRLLSGLSAPDMERLHVERRDFSAGVNSRMHPSHIAENQASVLYNVDISTPGQRKKRRGITLIEDLGNDAGLCAFGFEPDGGTNELLVVHGTKLEGYVGSGTFTEHDTGFTTGLDTQIIKVWKSGGDGSVAMIQNGIDNAHEMTQAHVVTDLTGDNDDPPKSLANAFFRGRWWILKDNELFFSNAYPSAYAGAFDQATDVFKIPVGAERAVIGLRDIGLVCIGKDEIWGINPTVIPAATDKAEKLLEIGCVARKTAITVGDDIMFLAPDGVRGIFRTVQDKLQLGQSFPLSYLLKDEFDDINWAYASKATSVYFQGRYLIALPSGSSTYNDVVWVYYPATKSWTVITGWNVADWAKITFSGEEKLYYIDSADGKVYQALYGYDDNSTAIDYHEEGREEDLGMPLNYKSGGELVVTAQSSGDYDLTVYASVDGGDYTELGTMNLSSGDSPTLPVSLPFYLAGSRALSKSFRLDALGRWKTIRPKIRHNDTNASDEIIVLETSIVTFLEEYR